MSLSRSFETWDAEHLWALYMVMKKPSAVSWADDIYAEVLMELDRRGALSLAPRTEGPKKARW